MYSKSKNKIWTGGRDFSSANTYKQTRTEVNLPNVVYLSNTVRPPTIITNVCFLGVQVEFKRTHDILAAKQAVSINEQMIQANN